MAITLRTLAQRKAEGKKFSVLTCYDATFSKAMSGAGIDVLLIGDTLGMLLQGHNSTLPVSVEDMAYHTAAVARGNQGSLIMADVPFMGAATLERSLHQAEVLMKAGANIIKIEGAGWLASTITTLKRNGVPVCAHLGLTPQSVNAFGGFVVQGKEQHAADRLIDDALALQEAGADVLLFECIPRALTQRLMQAVSIPVIGIGAGPECDGQVLVMHDMLGVTQGRVPRFVKNFMAGSPSITDAFTAYDAAVKNGTFPADEHCF